MKSSLTQKICLNSFHLFKKESRQEMLAQVIEDCFQMIMEGKSCASGECFRGNVLTLLPFLFGDFVFFNLTEFTQLFGCLKIS